VTPTPKPTPMACDKHNKGDLKLSDPGKVVVHAGQSLRVGVIAFGHDSKNSELTMGLSSLPEKGIFWQSYVTYIKAKEANLYWKVPAIESGKMLKFKFCAKANVGGKADGSFSNRNVSVEVLPELKETGDPSQTVVSNYITNLVYNTELKQLEVAGQIGWWYKSLPEERSAAILDPVEITDADTGASLGSAKVGLDGKWSATLPLPQASMPRVVDALFQGRVSTEPLTGDQ
jgi:hypothetical protein